MKMACRGNKIVEALFVTLILVLLSFPLCMIQNQLSANITQAKHSLLVVCAAFFAIGLFSLFYLNAFFKSRHQCKRFSCTLSKILRKRKEHHSFFLQRDNNELFKIHRVLKQALFKLREDELTSRHWPMELSRKNFDIRSNHGTIDVELRLEGFVNSNLESIYTVIYQNIGEKLKLLGSNIRIEVIHEYNSADVKLLRVCSGDLEFIYALGARKIVSAGKRGYAFTLARYSHDNDSIRCKWGLMAIAEKSEKTRIISIMGKSTNGFLPISLERVKCAVEMASLMKLFEETSSKSHGVPCYQHTTTSDKASHVQLPAQLLLGSLVGTVVWFTMRNKIEN